MNNPSNYFQLAQSWADEFYTAAIVSRNRWRLVCLAVLLPIFILLLSCILILIPLQHLEPLLINHYADGVVTVRPLKTNEIPSRSAEISSEIVRYVINRESYDAFSYHQQYELVNLLSSDEVARRYRIAQSIRNKNSLINLLGKRYYRKVRVENVIFLKRYDQRLAEVNFTIIDINKATGASHSQPFTALIVWHYRGTPDNPEEAWKNWDGFTVTHYSVTQRNLKNKDNER